MIKTVLFQVILVCLCGLTKAQELEPRALTILPIGTNFIVVGLGYANGNILFDPALPLEHTQSQLGTAMLAYVRAISFFGASGKVDIITPYAIGNWEGVYTGADTLTSRSGFGDIRARISFNFIGAPALKKESFSTYRPESISGFSLQIIMPTGQYFSNRLINLGSNRWVFKPQWGFSHNYEKWIWETYLSARFFTKNTAFWNGNELKQKPLIALKQHIIRKLPQGMWTAMSIGYAFGSQSVINDVAKDTKISTLRLGLTYAVPLGDQHSLKVIGYSGIRLAKGADFDSVSLLYQYRWNNKG